MLDFVLYLTFSVLETCAMFFLTFKMFKLDVYPKEMLFSGLIMAFFSYVIRVDYQWIELDIIIQYLLLFCFLWLLFRIHLFYAAILTGITYQAYTSIQLVFVLVLNRSGVFSTHTFYGIDIYAFLIQILSALTAILLGLYIGFKRKGFDFIPDKPNGLIKISNREKLLFILNLPTVAIVISIMHLFSSNFFYAVPLIYAFLLFCYMYLSYKKDRSGHEYIKF